jgi:hypothetical protein
MKGEVRSPTWRNNSTALHLLDKLLPLSLFRTRGAGTRWSEPFPDQRKVVRADCVADRDVDSVARDVRMVSVQAVHNGEQVCRADGAPRDESPCLAAWMDKCSTEDGAVHSLHYAVMSVEAA